MNVLLLIPLIVLIAAVLSAGVSLIVFIAVIKGSDKFEEN